MPDTTRKFTLVLHDEEIDTFYDWLWIIHKHYEGNRLKRNSPPHKMAKYLMVEAGKMSKERCDNES